MLPSSHLLSAALLVATAIAIPNGGMSVSTSIYTTSTDIVKYGPARFTSPSLSTKVRMTTTTVHSTVTACASPSTITTTITPDPVTITTSRNATLPSENRGAVVDVSCTSTTTISASVATAYTGTYSTSFNSTTAAAASDRVRAAAKAKPGRVGNVFHHFGQNALINQKPFEVDCMIQVTTYIVTTTAVRDAPMTETVIAQTPTFYVTQQPITKGFSATGMAHVSITTTLTAPPSADSSTNGLCTVTEGATSTTTQHIKCAPTNLISQTGGKGIGQVEGSEDNTQGLAPGSDASACCQLCVDTDGCAASEDDPDAGNCFLWYTSNPICGLGFKYSDGNSGLSAGAGFLVQSGCGSIEETDAPTVS